MQIGPIYFEAQWWWLILAIILGIAEMVMPGVFLIWLGAAAALTGIITLTLGIGTPAQFAIFAVAGIVAVYAGRTWLKRHPITSSDPDLNDRTARLIGQTVLVVEAIDGGHGRVKVGDGVWLATGPDAVVGSRVKVVGADGSRLKVEPFSG